MISDTLVRMAAAATEARRLRDLQMERQLALAGIDPAHLVEWLTKKIKAELDKC